MKHRRKSHRCLNCQTNLTPDFEFCPTCGQENTDNYVSLGELLNDLFGNYLSLDSRLGRSLIPFLFFPDRLPRAFIKGERMKYLPPVRLYLIVSVLYFFVFNQTILKNDLDTSKINEAMRIAETAQTLDTISEANFEQLASDSIKMQALIAENPSLNNAQFISAMQNVRNLKRKSIEQSSSKATDSLADSTQKGKKREMPPRKTKLSLGDIGDWELEKLRKWATDPNMTPSLLLDSMGIEDKNEFSLKMAAQVMKVGRNDLSIFIQNIVGNASLMMILLLPVFAFYLKILYVFSKKLYIGHLILMLYFQSFIYFAGSVELLLIYALDISVETALLVATIWIFLYIFVLFYGVYQQNYFLTFLKINIFSFLYFLSLVFALLGEMFFSFLFF